MKDITADLLLNSIKDLIIQANTILRPDVVETLKKALVEEDNTRGKKALQMLLDNVVVAKEEVKPICQDTGYVDVYFKWPQGLRLRSDLIQIVNDAVKDVYSEYKFRKSLVSDPIFKRQNTDDNTPANISIETSSDDKLTIKVLVKGAGSDNASAVLMLNPSISNTDLTETIVNHVKVHGAKSCPPLIIGIGVGSTFDKAASLSKRALLRTIGEPNKDGHYAALEEELLNRVNDLGIGPSGLGGKTTALAVHIEQAPCHMATMPVAVNLNCYALRTAETTIGIGD